MSVSNLPQGTAGTMPADKTYIKVSPLDLNNIRLDNRHTVLTPEYLDELIKGNGQADQNPQNSPTT